MANQQKVRDPYNYDKIFHQNTGSHNPNYTKKLKGNKQMLDYQMFTGQYEQQQQNPFNNFNGFNENARKNRQDFNQTISSGNQSVEIFNNSIDKLHIPFDRQRPIATRDQVKNHYEDEHKSLYSHKKTNEYVNQHQFMPGQLGNGNRSRFDFYSMNENQSQDDQHYEDFF